MNTTLARSRVAAVALALLPAAWLAAAPAHAQVPQRAIVAQPDIRSVTLDSSAGVAPGAVLRVQLLATPGARNAHVALAGSQVRVPLREVAPGRYVGNYTVRRGDRIDVSKRLTARASYGSRTIAQSFAYPASFQALAMGNARRDERPPQVSDLFPANGSRVDERQRTTIQARLDDRGTGVDPRSVRLVVDGLDVTADARITEDGIAYREHLGNGLHRAELVVRDRAGNVNRTAWSFRVV